MAMRAICQPGMPATTTVCTGGGCTVSPPPGGTGRAKAAGAAAVRASRAAASPARALARRGMGWRWRVRFMVTSWWSLGLRRPTVAGDRSLVGGGLGVELGAQPADLAGGAAQPPFGALGAAGGPGQRERALRGALLLGGGEPLAVAVGGMLGELVHSGPSSLLVVRAGGRAPTVTGRGGRSPYVAGHRTGTGLGWGEAG